MAQLQCIVVTPESTVLDEQVDFVALPLYDGEIGIAPGRSPLIGRLGYGELRLVTAGQTRRFYVDAGFIQVANNVVSVLTNRAVPASSIDPQVASEQLQHAISRKANSEELLAVRDRLERQARGQLLVASRARWARNRTSSRRADGRTLAHGCGPRRISPDYLRYANPPDRRVWQFLAAAIDRAHTQRRRMPKILAGMALGRARSLMAVRSRGRAAVSQSLGPFMLPPLASRLVGLITIDELAVGAEFDGPQACDETLDGLLIGLLHGRCLEQPQPTDITWWLPEGRFARLERSACEPPIPVFADVSSLARQLERVLVEARERIALAGRTVG